MSSHRERDIDKLNSLLRAELAALEAYDQCIDTMDDPAVIERLRRLQRSHERRAIRLDQRIHALGGTPETRSGPWGTFAEPIEGGELFGKSAAISVLAQGEHHGERQYSDLDELSPTTLAFVMLELLPEQHRSYDILTNMNYRT